MLNNLFSWFSSISKKGVTASTPALLTKTSSWLNSFTAKLTSSSCSFCFETSLLKDITLYPFSLNSFSVSSNNSLLMSWTTILKPSFANLSAIALPKPPAEPVIIATLFSDFRYLHPLFCMKCL